MRGPQPLGYARISLLLTLLLGGCGEPQQPTYEFIRGATMGTYYRVQFEPSTSCRPSRLFWINSCSRSIKVYRLISRILS